ncbi:beta strand repeat-containing protein [Microbacterium sp. NIBRBAC000506063]|uniref:beta strand repeat-containing protein n=1 Tax=Microbacterium sp. NIBRBAC000506063 TaxID=2734618 RepID=UPI001BB49E01|nr:hypothetical protein [Microbacterium sp. NIBRBAC000506063]QTV78943.1 hypothetical protein KAE78_06995 [Microbacterium sp. NIBRBAC000506063]
MSVTRTFALIGEGARTTALVTGGTITAGGEVSATAESTQTAAVDTDSVSVAGIGVAVVTPSSRILAATRATLSSPIASQGARITATSANTVRTDVALLSITGLSVGVTHSLAEIADSAATEALVSLSGSAFNAGAGDVTVRAASANSAHAIVRQSGGGLITVSLLDAEATVDAVTRASVQAASATSRTFTVGADADNTVHAAASLFNISLGGGSGVSATATLPQSAGILAMVTLTGSGLAASGDVTVAAESDNTVSADVGRTVGGVISINGGVSSGARIQAPTTASFTGAITASTGVSVTADASNRVDADMRSTGISLVEAGRSNTVALIGASAATTASFGTHALATTGDVEVVATAVNIADVDTDTLAGGLGAFDFSQPTAQIQSATRAVFAGAQTGGTGLRVEAESANTAQIQAGLKSFGGVAAGRPRRSRSSTPTRSPRPRSRRAPSSSPRRRDRRPRGLAQHRDGHLRCRRGRRHRGEHERPRAEVRAGTSSSLLGRVGTASTPGGASLTMYTHAVDTATAALSSSGGGVANINTGRATALVQTTVATYLGGAGGSIVHVSGDMALSAQSNPAAISSFRTSGGGAVNVSTNNATATATPTLRLVISDDSVVTAGGSITMGVAFNSTARPSRRPSTSSSRSPSPTTRSASRRRTA